MEKLLLDWLVSENLLVPLLEKTQYQTFDEIAKKIASWQLQYYPLSGENAVLGKINGTIKAVELFFKSLK